MKYVYFEAELEKHYAELLCYAKQFKGIEPAELVHETFTGVTAEMVADWPETVGIGFFMTRVRWTFNDLNKKQRLRQITHGKAQTEMSLLNDKGKKQAEKAVKQSSELQVLLGQISDPELVATVEKVLNVSVGHAVEDWDEVRTAKFKTIMQYLREGKRALANEYLLRFVHEEVAAAIDDEDFWVAKGPTKLRDFLKDEGKRISDAKEIRQVIQQISQEYHANWVNAPDGMPDYDHFVADLLGCFRIKAARYIEELGTDQDKNDDLEQQQKRFELLQIKGYLRSLRDEQALIDAKALLLHVWEGLSYAEVGKALGVSKSQAKNLAERAKVAVRTFRRGPR